MKHHNIYKLPSHVAIIMDGNGRWAKKRGLPRVFGHKEGAKAAEKAITFASELGIKYLTLFAFSTENWARPQEEVNFILKLLVDYIDNKLDSLVEKNINLRFLGRKEQLPQSIVMTIQKAEKETSNCTGMNLIIALNYSGRAEIIDAVNKIISKGISSVTEESFRDYLYFPDVPDPDLLIRTSGEVRISNFLLWQLAYSELYFTEVLWPDFDEEEFLKALYDYQNRERRFGRIEI
ncbi:MAG: isoprenyl transferase [Aquificae bacterium]|nr:isoprenyl transferase [Aquificota bacterium]